MIPRRQVLPGLELPLLSLGTVKIGRNTSLKYPGGSFELPSEAELENLLAAARELGCNLIDTAPAYGISEERLGRVLGGRWQGWLCSSKAGEEFDGEKSRFDFSPEAIRHSCERSLRRLRRDHLDLFLLHSDGNDLEVLNSPGLMDELSSLAERGLIRAWGASTKTVHGGLETLRRGGVPMIMLNLEARDELAVAEYAASLGRGVLVKKALASGHIGDDSASREAKLRDTWRFLSGVNGVSSVVIGTTKPGHLRQHVDMLNAFA
ncbi:MAG: hypothetical protein RL095_160 [Verrucomicrobiota bacterium]|jgi:aryl-alcohol dehydrogenase-like predicted oxidoreductase